MMKQASSGVKFLLFSAALMWLIQIFNLMSNYSLSRWGILPRDLDHLVGVLFAPLLHWSLPHIIANTIPFLVLGYLVQQTKHLFTVTVIVWLGGGLLVWLLGRGALHAGASGLIMGYFGFLISHAFFTRSFRSILISVITFLLYGGIFFTLLDFRSHISFEGHLFGFLTGILSAWIISRQAKSKR